MSAQQHTRLSVDGDRAPRRVLVAISLLGITVAACGDQRAVAGASIVGDWFLCTNPDCTEIADDGTRFGADGLAVGFDTVEGPVGEPPICIVLESRTRPYLFDGHTLRSGDEALEVELMDDRMYIAGVRAMTSHGEPPLPMDVVLRRLQTREADTCEDLSDRPPQVPAMP
jgi:hypothetical protein